jgi:serine/threonine-protein kinase RsbW
VALTVAVGPGAPAAARDAVAAGIGGRVADDVLGDARLLISELVSNCVRHAGLATDGVVRIGADGTAGTVAARPPTSQGGYGLHLVEALAHRWGVTREGFTRVWVELPAWPSVHGLGNADVRVTR